MQTRQLSDNEIQAYEMDLAFNRFTVHIDGEKLQSKITELSDKLHESEKESNAEFDIRLKNIYHQLIMYFGFYKRDKELTNKYLSKYNHCCDTDLEKAETFSLRGYANTIDPVVKDQEQIFNDAIKLLPEDSNTESEIIKAFSLQYIALMRHRVAIANKTTEIEDALEIITQAIAVQRQVLENFSLIKIGLAESLHLKGVMLLRLANVVDKKYFNEANLCFEEASILEAEFCEQTKATHYLVATTYQSHAIVLANLQQYEMAINKIIKAYEIQVSIFKTDVHEDIAKTWHFKGDIYAMMDNHVVAISGYLSALIVKKKIKYKDDYMVNVTQKALIDSLNKLPCDDYVLAFEQHKKIYEALTGDHKLSFINTDETFTQLIKEKMNELRDKVSMQNNTPNSAHRFNHIISSVVTDVEYNIEQRNLSYK